MLVGDDVKKVTEAAEHAKSLIGCEIMQNEPYYRSSGHVQARTRSSSYSSARRHYSLPCSAAFSCCTKEQHVDLTDGCMVGIRWSSTTRPWTSAA